MTDDSSTTQDSKDQRFAAEVSSLIDQSTLYRDQLSSDRITAMQYWDGEMKDMVPRKGWSQVVSRDVSATIKKVLPSLMRTILGNEIVAEYSGHNENDVEGGEQITDYINLIAFPESNGNAAVHDAMHDACLLRNGVLHVGIDEKTVVTGSKHTGLDEAALSKLLDDDEVEVLEASKQPVAMEDMPPPDQLPDPAMANPSMAPMGGPPLPPMAGPPMMPMDGGYGQPTMQPMPMEQEQQFTYDVKIKRTAKKKSPRISAVPPEEYLIHPDAIESQNNAPLVGREMRMSKSDLIAMGYDRDMIEALPTESYDSVGDGTKFTRRRNNAAQNSPEQEELEPVVYYDLYVRLDYDDDGIAELRHVCFAGGKAAEHMLMNEYADFVSYYDLVIERRPHQWEGVSVTDDVLEIQRVKTALLRYGMDNTYAVVTPQKFVNVDKLKGGSTDAVMNPEPGRPIWLEGTDKVSDAIGYDETPYVADKALVAVQYWDEQISDRTGIDDSSAGMPTDALQNVTAKASAMLEQKGIARTEMMVRTVAMCLKPVFAGLLKLVIQNQDKVRTVRLRDKWVEIDPRTWNAEMDVSINTGLGAGTRERDMMVMQNILSIQQQLITLFGPESPILKSGNIYNAVEKAVQAAGIKSVGKFFTKPDPKEVQAAMEAKANQKSPEQQKVDEQIRLLGEQSKANAAKEQAQAQADLITTNAKAQADITIKAAEKTREEAIAFRDNIIQKYEIDQRVVIEREKIKSAEKIALDRNKNELDKTKAGEVAKGITGVKDAETKLGEAAGKPAKDAGPKLVELLTASQKTMAALEKSIEKSNRPKKFIRDPKTGDIEGMEIAGAS